MLVAMPNSFARDKWLYTAAILYTFAIYGTMAVMSIGAGVVFAAWIACRWSNLRADLRQMAASKVFWPTVALAVACLWSLAWAKLSGLEFMGQKPTVTWDDTRKAWHLAFPFVLAAIFSRLSLPRLRRLTKLWLLLGVASAVLGLVQYHVPIYNAMELPHIWSKEYNPGTGFVRLLKGRYHATGFAGFHLSYASIIAFPAATCLGLLAVLYRRERFGRRTMTAAGAALLFFIANILTYSKIAWVAMPVTALLIAAIGFKGRARYTLIALVMAATVAWGTSSEVRLRFVGAGKTFADRMDIWKANIEMIKSHPLFGVGWHRNSELSQAYYRLHHIEEGFKSHAHSNIIDQWASTGLFGVAAFAWLNVVLIVLAYRMYKYNHGLLFRSLGLGLVGGWFCLHINGVTQSNWWDAKVLHQIGWVTAITIEAIRRLESSAKEEGQSEALKALDSRADARF